MTDDLDRRIAAVWRMESARIVAAVARRVRDVGLAEELAQDALVAALDHWPGEGVPANPGAWLMATAKNRALDHLRARALHLRKQAELGADADARGDHVVPDFSDALDDRDEIGDDLLRLVFTACHPVLAKDAQVALTLRLLGGLATGEIARAFLVPEPTIAQRIVRAKRTLTQAKVPFEVPRGAELEARLGAVLEVVYLIFNEGYTAARGDEWLRPQLCNEALRIGRVLTSIAPSEPEAHGLLALMEFNASRMAARTDAAGEPILLTDQNRALWDRLQIRRGQLALARARELGGAGGFYALQAAIAACHAEADAPDATDWRRIATLYGDLAALLDSPVIALNRAVAIGMAEGPRAALAIVDGLADEPALKSYHLLPSVRGDLLHRLGRFAEAHTAFEAAAALAGNTREREFLKRRAAVAARAAQDQDGRTDPSIA